LAAAGGAQDALVALFVVLLAVKLGEEGCRRVGQPPIIGEILAGVLVGPSVLGVVEPDAVLEVFAELGVVFPLFVVGVETRLADMRAVGGRALRVGVLGVFVPFLGGFALVRRSATTWRPPLLLGAALMATSAGITSAVLLDLGAGDRDATRTILGAAVIDDVLALVLLSVVVGSPAIARITSVGVLLIGSVVFIGVVAVGAVACWRATHARSRPPMFTPDRTASRGSALPRSRGHRRGDRPRGDHRRVPGRDGRRRDQGAHATEHRRRARQGSRSSRIAALSSPGTGTAGTRPTEQRTDARSGAPRQVRSREAGVSPARLLVLQTRRAGLARGRARSRSECGSGGCPV
jgi:hypothetical protein